MTFLELNLIAPILNALNHVGYTTPTPIQDKVREDGDLTQAAIASEEAARIWGLTVIARNINDQKESDAYAP